MTRCDYCGVVLTTELAAVEHQCALGKLREGPIAVDPPILSRTTYQPDIGIVCQRCGNVYGAGGRCEPCSKAVRIPESRWETAGTVEELRTLTARLEADGWEPMSVTTEVLVWSEEEWAGGMEDSHRVEVVKSESKFVVLFKRPRS